MCAAVILIIWFVAVISIARHQSWAYTHFNMKMFQRTRRSGMPTGEYQFEIWTPHRLMCVVHMAILKLSTSSNYIRRNTCAMQPNIFLCLVMRFTHTSRSNNLCLTVLFCSVWYCLYLNNDFSCHQKKKHSKWTKVGSEKKSFARIETLFYVLMWVYFCTHLHNH